MSATQKFVVLGLLAAAAFLVAQASSAAPAGMSVRCSLHAGYTTGQVSNKGTMAGSVTCGRPFGKGSYHGYYRDNATRFPTTSETGSSKLSFKAGTVRGTYTVGPAPISGTAPWRGMFHITSGTRRFKHVSGTLKMTCAHRIPPLTDCTLSGRVTGI